MISSWPGGFAHTSANSGNLEFRKNGKSTFTKRFNALGHGLIVTKYHADYKLDGNKLS